MEARVKRLPAQSQGLLVGVRRRAPVATLLKERAELLQRVRRVQLDAQRFLEVPLRRLEVTAVQQCVAEGLVSQIVPIGDGDGVLEQPSAVLPGADLPPARGGEDDQHECAADNGGPPQRWPVRDGVVQPPGGHDVHADHGQVGEAIGVRLLPHLHDANDGQQRDEIPEPADEEVRPTPHRRNAQHRNGREQHGRPRRRPQVVADARAGDHPWMRIEDRQTRRPQGLVQVRAVGERSIDDPPRDRQLIARSHRVHPLLRKQRESGRGGGDGDERQLLDDQAADGKPGTGASSGRRGRVPAHRTEHRVPRRPEPPERPEVEHQQHERQRDEHRLRHEAGHECGTDERVTSPRWPSSVRRVGQEREHPEQTAQDVLALAHPCDRLGAQRVKRK